MQSSRIEAAGGHRLPPADASGTTGPPSAGSRPCRSATAGSAAWSTAASDAERIRLSESTAWSGAPSTADVSPTALRELPTIRRLLFAGRHARPSGWRRAPAGPTGVVRHQPAAARRSVSTSPDGGAAGTTVEPRPRHRYRSASSTTGRHQFRPRGLRLAPARRHRAAPDRGPPGRRQLHRRPRRAVLPGRTTATDAGVAFSGRAVESLHSDGRQGTAVEIRVHVEAEGGTVRRHADTVEVDRRGLGRRARRRRHRLGRRRPGRAGRDPDRRGRGPGTTRCARRTSRTTAA
jgi:hypothetical protein